MPFLTIPGTNERYALISFDKKGAERTDDPDGGLLSARILTQVRQDPPSHVFFFSHGWKGDLDAAKDQYDRWIKAMLDRTADRDALGAGFKPLWIGLHWPSLPFGDETFSGDSFDLEDGATEPLSPAALVETYLDRLGLDEDARPLIQTIVDAHQKDAAATELPLDAANAYRELADRIGRTKPVNPSGPPEEDGEPFDPDTAFQAGNAASEGADFALPGGFLGGILGPLGQLSYWTMKKRARTIGESGMHSFVASLMNAAPAARFHLMGHSFGTIVIASILGGPGAKHPLPRPVDSVVLVQGAVSLWAFADVIPSNSGTGYFNPFLQRKTVRGPIVVTRSRHDRAVGTLYPLASAVGFASPSFELDPEEETLPKHGAIGTYGIRGLPTVTHRPMLPEHGAYGFEPGKIYNLESSQFICKGGGVSGAHCDIDGPQVAHAIWQAALA